MAIIFSCAYTSICPLSKMSARVFGLFPNQTEAFLLLKFTRPLNILYTSPLSDTWLANIFSPLCLLFLLLNQGLWQRKRF